jgi:putative hemolysin
MFKALFVQDGRLLEKAQLLRQRVFFGSKGKDKDKFDRFCRHLVVIDKSTQDVVGTYRLLLGSVAFKNSGFYSEGEFDLRNIKTNCRGKLLEIGRACVDGSYRKYPVINLMWAKIISYIKQHNVRYVFGCASINNPSPRKIGALFKFFKKKCFAPAKLRVYPLRQKRYIYAKAGFKLKEKEVLKLMPSLVKGYLKMGAYVCSEPVWDKDFNTADFFMLLDTKKINSHYQRRFL